MIICQAYKFRLKTNKDIAQQLGQFAGSCRFVWNKALALIKNRLEHNIPIFWYNDLASLLRLWKQSDEYGFLKDTHSQILQQTLKDLDKAVRLAFTKGNGIGFPKFKKKYRHDSFRYPQGFKIDNKRIYLPKIGWVRFHKSQEVNGTPKNATVSRYGNHWYISIQVKQEIPEPLHPSASAVGIDMGVRRFATLSNGTIYRPLNSFRKLEKKLAIEQSKLSRKKKFSANWKKQKVRVSKVHIKIANARKDYLHKVSTNISKNHAVVVLETLKVKSMTASARRTKENPGRLVFVKSRINKAILDQGWYEFRRMLEYKQVWRGGKVITVPQEGTSTTCPICGNNNPLNRPVLRRRFRCTACGYENDSDLTAAGNILRRGLTTAGLAGSNACGDERPALVCEAGTGRKPRGSTARLSYID